VVAAGQPWPVFDGMVERFNGWIQRSAAHPPL
jgi:hypothetical protein